MYEDTQLVLFAQSKRGTHLQAFVTQQRRHCATCRKPPNAGSSATLRRDVCGRRDALVSSKSK